jgi:hypothetical protein
MSALAERATSDVSATSRSRFIFLQAQEAARQLQGWLVSEEALALPLNSVECETERRGREILRLMLQAHLHARGTGDVGPALQMLTPASRADGSAATAPVVLSHRRIHERELVTIVGSVAVHRTGYGAPGFDSVHPLDESASLPARSFSYEQQRRLVEGAIQGPFHEAVQRVEEATGVDVPKRSAEQIVREAAEDFDGFYGSRVAPPASETGPILVAAVDCKGIPMVKPEKTLRVVRRGKGKKANKKRMATVAAVFTQGARPRTPEEVVESLFRTGPHLATPEAKPPVAPVRPEHKRVWASVKKSKDEVIAEVAREVHSRDPDHSKRWVVVTDGERALQKRLGAALPGATLVLDIVHVLERVWKAAYCFYPEGSEEAMSWVRERAHRLLRGEVSQVVKGLRQSATKREFRGAKRETIDAVTAYFYNNRQRMRYDEYLRDGLPIASGAVEGACKNLVKDRMERSGMRWTLETAEALVKLRASYLSGDLEGYWEFHMEKDQAKLHPAGAWRVVEK